MMKHAGVVLATIVFGLAWICVPAAIAVAGDTMTLTSPDGRNRIQVCACNEELEYSIERDGRPIFVNSPLGLRLDSGILGKAARIANVAYSEHDETWKPVYGERSEIRDHYHQAIVACSSRLSNGSTLHFELKIRAYNEGIAIAYRIPKQDSIETLHVVEELTEFTFTGNHTCWPVYTAQGEYQRAFLDDVKPNCERPLLVEIEDGPAIAVAEARLVDFARGRLQPGTRPHSLRIHLGSDATIRLPYTTPWRVIMTGDDPCRLIEQNYLLLNLNDPCAIEDTSWIKPGKVIREVSLSTAGGKACVDFAKKMNIAYVEYDAGWYGHEYDDKADATTVTPDPKRVSDPTQLDLHEVIRYAKSQGIGIIVYVNRRALERQLDEILPLYREWGIAGIKYGFVRVGSQQWTTWLHEAVRKAAKYQMMVDIHDEYRPTGYERTYPNLMTQEGIRGNEEMPPAEHNTILPFTRGLCGAGDYTICWYTDRIKTTHAHQLACAVVMYSPWQFVFWYDRPSQFRGEPGTEFFKDVPTVWDETRVLDGAVGEYIVTARRNADRWFVGFMNSQKRRTVEIPLDFLPEGRNFEAILFTDASPAGDNPFDVAVERQTVRKGDRLTIEAAHNGGAAVELIPVAK
ncbi:glycoside hydrolase family 97 protein [Thermostilla marina]